MKIKKKYDRGTARVYVSRKRALKKLQLSLKDFRRLCILKGIYPREPAHIKKANKGSTENKIFYHTKDINFLAQEPLLQKFREYKVFLRRVTHARAKKNSLKVKTLFQRKPVFSYDHLVKERYPTFSAALRDLDDALCLSFAFSALTQSNVARPKAINLCRRLVTEFMHYVIEANALRKVFVSIKGIYYQAEIMGERVTWVVGHERSVGRANELDFTTMADFVDFYSCMLSFVNFRLFKSQGLFYPPQLQHQTKLEENNYDFEKPSSDFDERVYSLAFPLKKTDKTEEMDVTIDTFDNDEKTEDLAEKLRQTQALKTLFSNCKFFLNREVPKEPLAFVIRSCGGYVCWDDCNPNKFGDSLITHQVIDRNLELTDVNRVYIQPQWVFDCFNAKRILPTVRYAPSTILPPHLSPFVEDQDVGDYVPIERIEQLKDEGKDITKLLDERKEVPKKKQKPEEEKGMRVEKAKVYKESRQRRINEEGHNLKLKEMMIPKKHRRVYAKIKFGIKRKVKETNKLREKRARLSANE